MQVEVVGLPIWVRTAEINTADGPDSRHAHSSENSNSHRTRSSTDLMIPIGVLGRGALLGFLELMISIGREGGSEAGFQLRRLGCRSGCTDPHCPNTMTLGISKGEYSTAVRQQFRLRRWRGAVSWDYVGRDLFPHSSGVRGGTAMARLNKRMTPQRIVDLEGEIFAHRLE